MADLSLHVESCSSTTENVIPTLPQCQWLPWGASTHKGTWPFDHVTFWDDMTNKSHYISTTTVLMATKDGRMLTYLEVLFHISYITLWSGGLVNSRGKLKNPLPQCHGHHGPTRKATWTFDYVVFRDHLTNKNHYIPTTTADATSSPEQFLKLSLFFAFLL